MEHELNSICFCKDRKKGGISAFCSLLTRSNPHGNECRVRREEQIMLWYCIQMILISCKRWSCESVCFFAPAGQTLNTSTASTVLVCIIFRWQFFFSCFLSRVPLFRFFGCSSHIALFIHTPTHKHVRPLPLIKGLKVKQHHGYCAMQILDSIHRYSFWMLNCSYPEWIALKWVSVRRSNEQALTRQVVANEMEKEQIFFWNSVCHIIRGFCWEIRMCKDLIMLIASEPVHTHTAKIRYTLCVVT